MSMKMVSLVFMGILTLLALLTACSAPPPSEAPIAIIPSVTAEGEPSPTPSPTLPEPTAEPTLASGDTRISQIDSMEQVYVGAGEFQMGIEDDEAKLENSGGVALAEVPAHTLSLPGFWIDKFEVTNHQYSLCVAGGECEAPRLEESFLGIEYYANPVYAEYPVIYVDFFMAEGYCTWAGRRLPTEAEWEKAARGPEGRKYPWGSDALTGAHGNFCDGNCPKTHANPGFDDGYAETAPVGSYPEGASPYGAMDMAGNVWEWVDTIPGPYPYDPLDGREADETRPPEDVAFGEGPQRMWRGGTWANGVWWMRATVRYHSVPHYFHNSLGFRCASSD